MKKDNNVLNEFFNIHENSCNKLNTPAKETSADSTSVYAAEEDVITDFFKSAAVAGMSLLQEMYEQFTADDNIDVDASTTGEDEICSSCLFAGVSEEYCNECRSRNGLNVPVKRSKQTDVDYSDEPFCTEETNACHCVCDCEDCQDCECASCEETNGCYTKYIDEDPNYYADEYETKAIPEEINSFAWDSEEKTLSVYTNDNDPDSTEVVIVKDYMTRKPLCEECTRFLLATTITEIVDSAMCSNYSPLKNVKFALSFVFGAFPSTGYIPTNAKFNFTAADFADGEYIYSDDGFFRYSPTSNTVKIVCDKKKYDAAVRNVSIDERIACCICRACHTACSTYTAPKADYIEEVSNKSDLNPCERAQETIDNIRKELQAETAASKESTTKDSTNKSCNAPENSRPKYEVPTAETSNFIISEIVNNILSGEYDLTVDENIGPGLKMNLTPILANAVRAEYASNGIWFSGKYLEQIFISVKTLLKLKNVYTSNYSIEEDFGVVLPFSRPCFFDDNAPKIFLAI